MGADFAVGAIFDNTGADDAGAVYAVGLSRIRPIFLPMIHRQ
jgi:hypothetical protein